jgi:CBS domain-containing protein
MNVSEIMANVVQKLPPDASLMSAARLMRDYDIGCVLVFEDQQVLGIVTDRDLAVRATTQTGGIGKVSVGEVMSRNPVCCRIDDTIKQAASIMGAHQVRRLPVLDFEGRLAGIVSVGDICNHAAADLSAGLIGQVSERQHPLMAETG